MADDELDVTQSYTVKTKWDGNDLHLNFERKRIRLTAVAENKATGAPVFVQVADPSPTDPNGLSAPENNFKVDGDEWGNFWNNLTDALIVDGHAGATVQSVKNAVRTACRITARKWLKNSIR